MAKQKEYKFEVFGNFYKKSALDKFVENIKYLNHIDEDAGKKPLFKAEIRNDDQPSTMFWPLKIYHFHMLVVMNTDDPEIVQIYQERFTSKDELPLFCGGFHVSWIKGEDRLKQASKKAIDANKNLSNA